MLNLKESKKIEMELNDVISKNFEYGGLYKFEYSSTDEESRTYITMDFLDKELYYVIIELVEYWDSNFKMHSENRISLTIFNNDIFAPAEEEIQFNSVNELITYIDSL